MLLGSLRNIHPIAEDLGDITLKPVRSTKYLEMDIDCLSKMQKYITYDWHLKYKGYKDTCTCD